MSRKWERRDLGSGSMHKGRVENVEENKPSRQERLLAAKASFGTLSSDESRSLRNYQGNYWHQGQYQEVEPEENEDLEPVMHFGLVRLMSSVMLAAVLIAAFSTGFSYHGFDKAYLMKQLNDNKQWTRLERQVQRVAKNIIFYTGQGKG